MACTNHMPNILPSNFACRLPLLYLDMEGGRAGMGKENWKEGKGNLFLTHIARDFIFISKCTNKYLAAALCADPSAPPDPRVTGGVQGRDSSPKTS